MADFIFLLIKALTIRDRNTGLRIKQFYSVAIHPTTTNFFLGGAQDNGTHRLTNAGLGSSVEVTGGDGAFVAIDQNQPQYQFGAYVYNQYRRSTDGGNTWSSINFSTSAGQFINPFDYDNTNNRLYAAHNAGAYLRWDNPQTGTTSAIVSVAAFNAAKVTTVKVSPFTSNRVYFGAGGRIVKVDNANLAAPTAVNLTSASMPAGANVSCINTGTSDQYLMACFSNYGVAHIWVSTDNGANWTSVDGDLPNIPVRWCLFEPGDNTKAIIATETGVWETTLLNGAQTSWQPSLNFPTVRTDMIQYRSSDGTLAAATHGRGIYTTVITQDPSQCNAPAGLTTSSITTSTATLGWSAVGNAVSYSVDYKLSADATWINLASNTTATSVSLSGLSASSTYDWRVATNCAASVSTYSQTQFTTAAATVCPGPYDVSTNNAYTGAATIPFNTDVKGLINPSGDQDYYKFVITTGGTATMTLSLLPANYELRLYSGNGTTILATSSAGGTNTETISRTFTPGIYYVSVYGRNNGATTAAVAITLRFSWVLPLHPIS
jgi:hypothetical protein